MGIHRDTLYQWMREFDVDFSDVDEGELFFEEAMKRKESTYLIGEALISANSHIASQKSGMQLTDQSYNEL